VFGELRWRALSDYHTRGPFSFIPLIANAESIFGLGLTSGCSGRPGGHFIMAGRYARAAAEPPVVRWQSQSAAV